MKEKNKLKKSIQAFILDVFLWSYTFLVSYKIVYVRLVIEERYPQFYWGQVIYCLIAGAAVSAILFIPKGFSFGKRCFGLHLRNLTKPAFKSFYILYIWFVLALTFVAGLNIAQVSIYDFLSETGLGGAKRIFSALLTPNFNIFNDALFAAIETIYMAFIATVFAIPIAFVLSFLAARNLMIGNRISFFVYNLTRFILNISRSIEPLIWAIIFSVWVGIGPFAGMLALFLHSVASLAKLYSEQIEDIDDGPVEAMTATGSHPIQVIWYGVVPQITIPFLSFTIYRWDINVRMATVIGLVGGGGIGTMLMQYQGQAKWNEVGLLVMVIAFIVWAMDYSSAKIREAIK